MRRLLVLLTLLASVRAESETTTKARATAVRKIELLAGWCAEQSLFARLHDLYARLLVFEPDHARARRRLGSASWSKRRFERASRQRRRDCPPIEAGDR